MPNNNYLKKKDPVLDLDSVYMPDAELAYADDYYGAMPESGGEKQQLYRLLGMLRKYWILILAINFLVTGLVVVYEAQKPDYYRATARIQVDNESNPAATQVIVNQGTDPAYFTTQLQILEGSGLLRRVVKTLDLENNPQFLRPPQEQRLTVWQNVKRMFGLYRAPAEAPAKPEALATKTSLNVDNDADLDKQAEKLAPYVGFIRNGLDVSPVNDSRTASKITRLIEVEYTHFDPAMATKVANTIADTYVLQNLERKVESNASTSDFLQKRVAELQSQIRQGEERLINYAKSNQILSLDPTQNTVVQKLNDLNTRLNQAESDRLTAETAYRAAMQNPMRTTTAEVKDARTSGLEAQLSSLKQQLTQLKTEYTDEWIEVKKVRQQIANIERELATNRKRAVDTELAALEQTYRQAAAREKELRENFSVQRSAVLNQNEAAINYRIIQQEIDTNKALLDNLLQKSRETEVVMNGTTNNVHVVDRALTPRGPAGPNRTKNVITAFFASLLVGLGLAFLLSWLDDTIRVSDNLESQIGLPVLGLIPSTAYGLTSRLIPARLRKLKRGRNMQELYRPDKYEKPVIVEAFHQLRTSLLLSTAGGSPQTVLVTSGQPAEGKTVVSLNLAKSLSQLGHKVLLVDADLRCPKMHLIHNLSNAQGLSNLLTVKSLNQEVIDRTIKHDFEENLDLLTSGPHVPNPANLLGSAEMRVLLERLAQDYTHIVIDSPPVLYFADTTILSTIVDAVVLIARENVSSRDVLAQAKRRLGDVRANIIGVVLNDIKLKNFQYKNYDYYKQLEEPEFDDANVLKLDK